MKKILIAVVALFTLAASTASAQTAPTQTCDPYKDYSCLDNYLGSDFFSRFVNYYSLEMGHATAPADPNAPPAERAGWPTTPESTPPMPFTEWPHGATTPIGVSRPNSVDSPLMAAMANSSTGHWLQNNNIQIYGWIDGGFNLSSNTQKPGGNAPMAYMYTPNTAELDQAVLYIERVPDTVQTDHVDWGFRVSGLYGENYRYTTAYGIASYQLLKDNNINGYDFPMMYGELYIPDVSEGLLIRVGRYISIPDIEAQLAPNNYMYSHSMTYGFDNYTNEGIVGSLAVTKQLLLQAGVVMGTESALWHYNQSTINPDPGNVLYPGRHLPVDPGAEPTLVACARYTWNDGKDDFYPCMDGINSGNWGYNNLQWYGGTYYHKFNDEWHISFESYELFERHVPNANNTTVQDIVAAGGTPFASLAFNSPGTAQCNSTSDLTCTAQVRTALAYLNYQFSPLDNISFRPELYDDMEGQRTGVRTRYANFGIGWQHWLSPQVELRPEVDYDYSLDRNAFNGYGPAGVTANKDHTELFAMDAIVHF